MRISDWSSDVCSSDLTHVAAVSVVFPITFAICHGAGLDPTPYYVAVAFAASASFHAPFSYQTNLMVYGPGGYKFKDFLKFGIPFTLIYSVICIVFFGGFYEFYRSFIERVQFITTKQ